MSETKQFSVEVDTVEPEKLILPVVVAMQVVDPEGPGGGWPIVRLTGPMVEVCKILKEQYGMSDDEIAGLF